MKKIISALVVFVAVSGLSSYAACSQSNEAITGAACSIKDLKALEKSETQSQKIDLTKGKAESDLRPVNIYYGVMKSNEDNCLFGPCLRSRLSK